jgi:hypothetical protein
MTTVFYIFIFIVDYSYCSIFFNFKYSYINKSNNSLIYNSLLDFFYTLNLSETKGMEDYARRVKKGKKTNFIE